jgi:hypothetical protein
LNKIYRKFFDIHGSITQEENMEWLKDNVIDYEHLVNKMAPELWNESILISNDIKDRSTEILSKLDIKLGGGGIYPFLYFINKIFES